MRLNPSPDVLRRTLFSCGLLLLAVLLFFLSFPSPVSASGIFVLGWFALVPVFLLVRRLSWLGTLVYGALYGALSYLLFNYWLTAFHPLAGIIVSGLYAIAFLALFALLKLALLLFPRRGYLVQALLWLSFEYLKTTGFLGYPYGVVGYTQWQVLPLIQIASIGGVWAVSALLVFFQAFLAALLDNRSAGVRNVLAGERLFIASWSLCIAGSLAFGFLSPIDTQALPHKRIALIQANSDPWVGGLSSYRENLAVLKRLSGEALSSKPDLVVWSETAFVPRIYWHATYREDQESWLLVKDLLDWLKAQDVPFVIGNDDGRREVNAAGDWDRVDYNAVLLFVRGEERGAYRKLRLVPFTENFPYEKALPFVYNALLAADTHFWKAGTDYTVFESGGMRFSTPICFEDSFGYISRGFVSRGADFLVNVTNDAWAQSLPSQMQHASMAAFRAVENRRSLVRATASGQTCAFDPNGRLIAMAKPFAELSLSVDVPSVTSGMTFYTRYGDWLPALFVFFSIVALFVGTYAIIVSGTSGLTTARPHRKMGERINHGHTKKDSDCR